VLLIFFASTFSEVLPIFFHQHFSEACLKNVINTLKNVATFFNENVEPTFFIKLSTNIYQEELYQHFSKESVRFNIFPKCFTNNFHEKCLSTFSPNVQRFSEKINLSSTSGPPASGGTAYRRTTAGRGRAWQSTRGREAERRRPPVISAARGQAHECSVVAGECTAPQAGRITGERAAAGCRGHGGVDPARYHRHARGWGLSGGRSAAARGLRGWRRRGGMREPGERKVG
jgi:hypothetical protein